MVSFSRLKEYGCLCEGIPFRVVSGAPKGEPQVFCGPLQPDTLICIQPRPVQLSCIPEPPLKRAARAPDAGRLTRPSGFARIDMGGVPALPGRTCLDMPTGPKARKSRG